MTFSVKELALVNFRSYPEGRFGFGERTVLVGPNAAGKTNLLEALYLLAATKSFRADREREMIHWGEDRAQIRAVVTTDREQVVTAELLAGPRLVKKSFSVDGNKQKTRELVRRFPMTLFSADDVRLIDGAPGRRRRALDLVLGQSSATYHEALSRYGRVVASRNRLLEQVASGEAGSDQLEYWDAELVETGQRLVAGRTEFAAFANQLLPEVYAAMAQAKPVATPPRLQLAYEPLSTDLAADVPRRRAQDLAVGTTTLGPHRDDWRLTIGNRALSSFGSGGEYRSAMLAFRLAEAAWLRQRLETTPVILLDDVFSELDEFRRSALLHSLPTGQVIITTPEAGAISADFLKTAQVTEIRPRESRV